MSENTTKKAIVRGTIISIGELRDYADDSEREYDYVANLEVRVPTDEGIKYYEVALYDDSAIAGILGKTVDYAAMEYVETRPKLRVGQKVMISGNLSEKPFKYTRGKNKGKTITKPRLTCYGPDQVSELKISKPTVSKPKKAQRTRKPV